jgi:hypothetical protein
MRRRDGGKVQADPGTSDIGAAPPANSAEANNKLSKEETMMKSKSILAIVIVGSGLVLHVAQAQQPGVKRTELQRYDLSIPGRVR